MRLFPVLVAALLGGASTRAQDARPSSSGQAASSAENAAASKLPVSLHRIREALTHPPPAKSLLNSFDRPPDFKVQIEERRTIVEILSALDSWTGPVPAGGLYAYEQQRRLFNPLKDPLAQPYAAFSGAELLTIAVENLMIKYLGGRFLDAVTRAERAQAEKAARAEVAQVVTQYCDAKPNRRESVKICAR